MKTICLTIWCCFLAASLFSQNETGLTPASKKNPTTGTTRAVVIGISDYQDVGIPDLNFADRDAEAFAEWLKSSAGGSVPDSNIIFLVNEQATNARIAASLDLLIEVAAEGEQVVIYFSGHGDVETKTRGQFGFLLAWDSPPTNYKAGAYSIIYLQDIISTLSIDKKARVTVVTDACHAGKLAGSSIGGTQATAQALSQQFANEVKIMSCQPNEFSLEGQQWGNGRGVFSYHLLDGLSGLADENGDGMVALREIGRFLEDEVPAEAAPHQQTPLIVGDRNALLAKVDAATLAVVQGKKKTATLAISNTGSKGLADGYLANADSATQAMYHAFETALAAGNLLDGDSSADFFYQKLLGKTELKPLHGLMRRNLAVALQDEVQQALNALLADDPYETNHFLYNPEKYAEYPRYLERTIELLGEGHYMYPALRSKELYFESYNLTQSLNAENITLAFQDSIRPIAQQKLWEAMDLDSTSGYLYYAYAMTFYNDGTLATYDSILIWHKLAVSHSPQWLLPYFELAFQYAGAPVEKDEAEYWMNSALDIKPNSYKTKEQLSWLYQWQNRTDESLALSDNMILERPELFNAYSTAGVTCMMRKEYERAEAYFKKSLAIEPSPNNWAQYYFVKLLTKTRRQQQAIVLADSILNNPASVVSIRLGGLLYLVHSLFQNEQYELAAEMAKKLEVSDILVESVWTAALAKCLNQIKLGNPSEARALLPKVYEVISPGYYYDELHLFKIEAMIAEKEGNYAKSDSFFQAALRIAIPKNTSLVIRTYDLLESLQKEYGCFLLRQKRGAEALTQFQMILNQEPNSWRGYYGMALFHAQKGEKNTALDWLEKSLDHWLPTPELANDEPLFFKIKNTKRFKALMAKHFPPK